MSMLKFQDHYVENDVLQCIFFVCKHCYFVVSIHRTTCSYKHQQPNDLTPNNATHFVCL